jgi:iron complex outermembrane receptor protein
MPGFAIRGTVSTGFRAPTPGQINTLDVTTTADSTGALILQGTVPVDGPVAQTLGAESLEPEESLNLTLGIIWQPRSNIALTVDFYEIDVDNRVSLLTQSITAGSPEDLALIAAGFPGVRLAGFFANAFDTRVHGVETALTANWDFLAGELGIDIRHSWQQQEIQEVLFPGVSPEMLFDFENQLPSQRLVATARYDQDRWGGYVRANIYDSWQDLTFGELGEFEGEWLWDAEVHLDVTDQVEIAVGAENIFDQYPDAETNSTLVFLGATRPVSSPFGFNGGQWYARVRARF